MINPNWARWIFASAAKYFQDTADDIDLPLLVEGADEREAETLRAVNHAELRINGPAVQELSKGYYRLWVDINILISTLIGEAQQNTYDAVQYTGVFQNAAAGPIPVYQYGTGEGESVDDETVTQLGCLVLRHGPLDAIAVHHFGQLGKTERIKQSAVDMRYEMYLTV